VHRALQYAPAITPFVYLSAAAIIRSFDPVSQVR